MSLTRNQWVEFWEEVKVLERYFQLQKGKSNAKVLCLTKIQSMKEKIELVIGQME